ncbi:hotdog fold domain-containing protein [Nocardia sp. CNY236]|uniref:hotdog fold domain-containing protein n=1 Tax=Nocardia sp. CNY236 TaxID=1169152 RepID=UPI000414F2C5|nr:hotdog fold domain-containing protein [Nocardia sp. CNY236]
MTTETATYRHWKTLAHNRLGRALFDVGLMARVPYFATVLPKVARLEPELCEVTSPKWFGVLNHLGTFHVIAACNLAEVAMGMLSEATIPTTHRWIPKAMSVQYLAKGETSLRAVAKLPERPDFATITAGYDLVIPVSVYDGLGVEVVHAEITIWVTPNSPASKR